MESTPLVFILNMAAAAALLIWAVRLVRTGFERAFGGQLRLWLRRSTSNRFLAAGCGASAAVLMQSSTAVAMLMAGFVTSGAIGGFAGLSIVLGADLGTAIVALALNSKIAIVTPLLLLTGVFTFLRSSRRRPRQIGRILIGLALIFLSLDLIRQASAPLASNEIAKSAMLYLSSDVITAFFIAAVFAWLVHSSVAAVLLFATLAAHGTMPAMAALSMVLGANLGGSLIAFYLTMKSATTVRRVITTNLILRGGGAFLTLAALSHFGIPQGFSQFGAGQQALYLHLVFNFVLMLLGLILLKPLMQVASLLVPEEEKGADQNATRSALDPSILDRPKLAFSCAVRELVEMGNRVEAMLRDVMGLFEHYDEKRAETLRHELENLTQISLEIRRYLSQITGPADAGVGQHAFDLSGITVNLEASADMIANKMVELAKAKDIGSLKFSDEGWRELTDFHDVVLRNVQHGISVLLSDDVGIARELVEQKEKVRDLEQNLQRKHLDRLGKGLTETLESSTIHLDLLRTLKTVNSSFAMIAYPVLQNSGELLVSRLAAV